MNQALTLVQWPHLLLVGSEWCYRYRGAWLVPQVASCMHDFVLVPEKLRKHSSIPNAWISLRHKHRHSGSERARNTSISISRTIILFLLCSSLCLCKWRTRCCKHNPKQLPSSCFPVSRRYGTDIRQLSILPVITYLYWYCERPHYRCAYIVVKIRLRWAQHLECQVIWLIVYYFCRQKPGELDYADLEDLRADIQLGPVPSGGAAAAAPIVRPPPYEGTEYADISQFGVPQPDPTYANVPKQEVVYSNVESMWALTNTPQLLGVVWIFKGPVTPWHCYTAKTTRTELRSTFYND